MFTSILNSLLISIKLLLGIYFCPSVMESLNTQTLKVRHTSLENI